MNKKIIIVCILDMQETTEMQYFNHSKLKKGITMQIGRKNESSQNVYIHCTCSSHERYNQLMNFKGLYLQLLELKYILMWYF